MAKKKKAQPEIPMPRVSPVNPSPAVHQSGPGIAHRDIVATPTFANPPINSAATTMANPPIIDDVAKLRSPIQSIDKALGSNSMNGAGTSA